MIREASLLEIVRIALSSWVLIAVGLGVLFVALLILNKLTAKKDK